MALEYTKSYINIATNIEAWPVVYWNKQKGMEPARVVCQSLATQRFAMALGMMLGPSLINKEKCHNKIIHAMSQITVAVSSL